LFFDPHGKMPASLRRALCVSLLFHVALFAVPDRPVGGYGGLGVRTKLTAVLQGIRPVVVAESVGADVQPEVLGSDAGTESQGEPARGLGQTLPNSSPDALGIPLISPVMPPLLPDPVKPVAPVAPESPRYFRRSELTVAPMMQDEPQIDAFENMGRGQTAGRLALRLFISASGTVERIDVVSSTLPADVEEIAMSAFLPLRFKPGEIDGAAVSSQVVFEVDLDGPLKGSSRSSDHGPWNIVPKGSARIE